MLRKSILIGLRCLCFMVRHCAILEGENHWESTAAVRYWTNSRNTLLHDAQDGRHTHTVAFL